MKLKIITPLSAVLVLSGVVLAGCSSSVADRAGSTLSNSSPVATAAGSQLGGTITLSGANALYPLAVVWGQEFQKLHPKVKIDVTAGGAGKGMTDTLSGFADIGMISRAVDPAETAKGAYPIGVAKDAVVAEINVGNPALKDILAKGVKKSTFAGIFVDGTVKTWGDVIGRPEIKDPVNVYTRSDSSGAADIWALYIAGKKQDSLKGVGVTGDPGILAALQNDTLGIAFNNYSYAFDVKSGLPVRGIQIIPFDANENGVVDQSEDVSTKDKVVAGIKSETFPHPPARVELFVTRGKPTGIVAEFIKWALTDGQRFVDQAGYVQLTQDSLTTELAKLN